MLKAVNVDDKNVTCRRQAARRPEKGVDSPAAA
jgi:hypothetical protein